VQPITIWRRLTQIAVFVVTGQWLAIGWLRCPFAVPFVSCPSCPLTDCPGRYLFLPTLGLVALVGLVSGRAFCGWACPMGLVEDALGRLPKPSRRSQARWSKVDRVLKWARWPILALVAWAVLAYNYQPDQRAWEYAVRSQSLLNLESYGIAWALGGGAYKFRFALLMVALVGALFVSRFWCRYLCPLGTLLSPFNKFSLLALHRRETSCTACGKYPRECPQYTVPGTTDCVMCGECVQGCPAKAITLRPRLSRPKPPPEVEAPT
jgi:polyferredoxin